jgi:hypothetical protein
VFSQKAREGPMVGFIVCAVVAAVTWAVYVRDGLREDRKMAELEAELSEAKGKLAAKQ